MEGNDVFFQTTSLPFIQHPTQRAADGGYVPHFWAGFWRGAFLCRGPLQPSPPPLTQTVGRLRQSHHNQKKVRECYDHRE